MIKVELGIHFLYSTIMPETALQIELLDYKDRGPPASSNFKHIFQALFGSICVLSQLCYL